MKYIDHIEKCFSKAILEKSKINEDVLKLEGFSAPKNRHFLNNLLELDDSRYLEIGVLNGSTFISSLYENNPKYAVAIDNWSLFGGRKYIFENNCKRLLNNNYDIYEIDCFCFNKNNFKQKFNIYFYDGEHNEEDQYKALEYYLDVLDDNFIYICDDWNWDRVRNGTKNAIKNLNINIDKQWELHTKMGHDGNYINGDLDSWWNGLYVAVLSKNNK